MLPCSPGIQANHFGLAITGASNLVVVIEACTNLANPNWYPLQTNTLNGNSLCFADPNWTDYGSRFYRLAMPWGRGRMLPLGRPWIELRRWGRRERRMSLLLTRVRANNIRPCQSMGGEMAEWFNAHAWRA